MDHGERWIVPTNMFVIAAFVVLWGVAFPIWTTLLIAIPIALALAYIGSDKYGGMQVVLLVAPACLMATGSIAKEYRDALVNHSELSIVPLILRFVGTVAGGAIVFFIAIMAAVGVAIAWEWFCAKVGLLERAKVDRESLTPEPKAAEPEDEASPSP